MKKALLALLAFGTLSAVAMPANADSARVQDASTSAITTGIGNDTNQTTIQRSRGVRVNPFR